MASLHKDIDILKYEPNLFASGTLYAAQSYGKGANGTLSGSTLTVTGGNFQTVGVQAGHVVLLQSLDGMINGAYEIAAVVSNTVLTVSALRAETTDPVIPIGTGSGLIWRIMTFAPQAAQAAFGLSQQMGLKPGCPESLYGFDDLRDASVLKQASVFMALAIIYGGLYGSGTEETAVWNAYKTKQEHYAACAEAVTDRCRLSLED